MRMTNTKIQSKETKQRVFYDLDALGSITVPNLGLQLAYINTYIGPVMKQVTSIALTIDAIVRPIREAIESFREMFQRIIEPVKEMMKAYATTFRFLTTFKPVYYVPTPAIAADQPPDPYLPVARDEYEYFMIADKKLTILHPKSSRGGKILDRLLQRKAEIVTYHELKQLMGAGDLNKELRSLRYQLKKQGYHFDYQLVRTHGIALKGLTELQ